MKERAQSIARGIAMTMDRLGTDLRSLATKTPVEIEGTMEARLIAEIATALIEAWDDGRRCGYAEVRR